MPAKREHASRIIGALHTVMWKGELFARIDFDTLSQKENLYALGPIEGLQGEFMVLDGLAFKSEVIEGRVVVNETFALRAPFAGSPTLTNGWLLTYHLGLLALKT